MASTEATPPTTDADPPHTDAVPGSSAEAGAGASEHNGGPAVPALTERLAQAEAERIPWGEGPGPRPHDR